MRLGRWTWSILLGAALMLPSVASASDDLWFHVRVSEAEGAKVMVNLPLRLVEKALPMIPAGIGEHASIHLEDSGMTAGELRELWREIQASPDMTFVSVEEEDETVRVWKEGSHIMVRVVESEEGGEEVNVRLPIQVVDALLSGEGEALDFEAGIGALKEFGEGELVRVSGGDDQVQVWIDGTAEAD